MEIAPSRKRQYLTEFMLAFTKLYTSELLYKYHVRDLVKSAEILSSKDSKKLDNLIPNYQREKIFMITEHASRYHCHNTQKDYEVLFQLLPKEIQELIKMDLRLKRILIDNKPLPGQDFDLYFEIERFIKVELETLDSTNNQAGLVEAYTSDKQTELTRITRSAIVLSSMKNMLASESWYNLATQSYNQHLGKIMWQAEVVFQKLFNKNKLPSINELFFKYLSRNISYELHTSFADKFQLIFKHQETVIDSIKNLRAATALLYGYQIKQDEYLTPIAGKATPTRPSENKDLNGLYTALNSAIMTLAVMKDLINKYHLSKTGTNHDALIQVESVITQFKDINLDMPDFKLTLQNVKVKNTELWVRAFDIDRLKSNNPDFSYNITTKDKHQRITLFGNYGKSFASAEFNKSNDKYEITIKPILHHIQDARDLKDCKNIITSFAESLDESYYENVKITCDEPQTLNELCTLCLAHNLHIAIDEKSFHSLNNSAKVDNDLLFICIDPEIQELIHQCQNIFDIGLIPDLSEEATESLRIKTMAFKDYKSNKMLPGFYFNLSITNPVILLEQIQYCFSSGIGIVFSHKASCIINDYISKLDKIPCINIRSLTAVDTINRIQTILDIGAIPVINDPNTQDLLNDYIDKHITNNISYHLKIKTQPLDIAYHQLLHCLNNNIPAHIFPNSYKNKVFQYAKKHKLNTNVNVDFKNSLAAIDMVKYLANNDLAFELSIKSRRDIIMHNIQITNDLHKTPNDLAKVFYHVPTFSDFKRSIENGFLPALKKEHFNLLVKDIKRKQAKEELQINFYDFPTNSEMLLSALIDIIEKINLKLKKPISYSCDNYTLVNNNVYFLELITNELESIFEKAFNIFNDLKENISNQKSFNFSNGKEYKLQAITKLQNEIHIIQSNNKLGLNTKIERLFDVLNTRGQTSKTLKNYCEQCILLLYPIHRKIEGLIIHSRSNDNSPEARERRQKYVQLAIDSANNMQEQLFTRARAIGAAKPKIATRAIDIKSILTKFNKLNNSYMEDFGLIQSNNALKTDDIKQLNQTATLKRLEILGNRIADGMLLDDELQAELKELSLHMTKFSPIDNMSY